MSIFVLIPVQAREAAMVHCTCFTKKPLSGLLVGDKRPAMTGQLNYIYYNTTKRMSIIMHSLEERVVKFFLAIAIATFCMVIFTLVSIGLIFLPIVALIKPQVITIN